MKCKYCGCTDEMACPGGCCWVAPNVCSNCIILDKEKRLEEEKPERRETG